MEKTSSRPFGTGKPERPSDPAAPGLALRLIVVLVVVLLCLVQSH